MMVYQPAYERSSRRATPSEVNQDLDGQLLRYAHDLHDLMHAYTALNRRYQGLLLNMGRNLPRQVGDAAEGVAMSDDIRRLNWLAVHDTLTGLPNKHLLTEQIGLTMQAVQGSGQSFALVCIGLDRLDTTLANLDGAECDELLCEVVRRLQRAVRENDLVARLKANDFAVLLMGTHLQSDIRLVAENLMAAVAAPMKIGAKRLRVSCSMGCARFPVDGAEADVLLKNADVAMYLAKLEGGSHFHFYEAAPDCEQPFSMGLAIWGAVGRGEMHLVYQPQIAPGPTPTLRGCEALLRWHHPVMGEISPDVFIPVAERNGSIVPIGDWVLEQVFRQAASWQTSGLTGFRVSVNVAPQQLDSADFVERLVEIAVRAGVDATCIELEVSESSAMSHAEQNLGMLARLRQHGFRVAMDDFGKGYSNLSRLQTMPIDCLKIDKKFIQDLGRSETAKAVSRCFVDMGVAMGIEVVAEGVENDEQLAVLTRQGCHLIQGYLTGRPMSPQVFTGFLGRMQQSSGLSKAVLQ